MDQRVRKKLYDRYGKDWRLKIREFDRLAMKKLNEKLHRVGMGNLFNNNIFLLSLFLFLLCVASRLVPHEPNFTAVGAVALFSGMYLPKKTSIVIPLIAVFVSDMFIGFYHFEMAVAVYMSLALMSLIGLFVREHKNLATIIVGTLVGSLLFFLVTNFAVWKFETMYPRDTSGLWMSYEMAIPFFKNTILGNLFYVGLLVGGVELMSFVLKKRKYFFFETL